MFLWPIAVSDFCPLEIYKNLSLTLSTIYFTVNSYTDSDFYKNIYLFQILYSMKLDFFIKKIFFRWGTHLSMSLFPSVPLSIRHAPYLRNRTSPDHNFWYPCVKCWYFQMFFSFFFILIFWAAIGVKGQKIAQNEK